MDLGGKRMVIFGCGFLGTRVALQAREQGMDVTVMTRNTEQATRLSGLGFGQVVTGELHASAWHGRIEPRQDIVVNCVSSAGGGWVGYRKSYFEGMRSILAWAAPGSIQSLIFTSSTSVYAQANEEWVTEDDPADGSSEGGKILRESEALLEAAPLGVARKFILRLGGIYGPGRHHLLTRALAGSEIEEGDDRFLNSIHVDDATGAIWAAAKSGPAVQGGIFNIVDDVPVRKSEILRFLGQQVKERGLAKNGLRAADVRRRQRSGSRPSRRIANRKAKEVLQWRPVYADYHVGYEALLNDLNAQNPTG